MHPAGQPGLDARLAVVGIAVVLIGGLAAAQLWPKGGGPIATGPTGSLASPTGTFSATMSATATPFQTLTFPTVPPTAVPTPPLEGLGVASWPDTAQVRVLVPDGFDSLITGAWGPTVYLLDQRGALTVADLRQGLLIRAGAVPVLADERADLMAVDGQFVAVLASHQAGPDPGNVGGCAPARPLGWRLLAARVVSAGILAPWLVLAQGTASRAFTYPAGPPCSEPWTPQIAVAGTRIFIAEDSPTTKQPWASVIRTFDLDPESTGAPVLPVAGVVVSLSAAAGLVAWSATTGAPADKEGNLPAPSWSVAYAPVGSAIPVTIEAAGPRAGLLPVPTVAADDGVVWWGAATPSGGRIVRETFVAGDAPGVTVPAAPGLDDHECDLGGADAGTAVAVCYDSPSAPEQVPVLLGGGQARQVMAPVGAPVSIQGGWLTWVDPPYVAGVPLDQIEP